MKVIIDWVANHTGANHEWMDNHPDWFTRDTAGNFIERNGWEDVVDLNYENKEMRAALIGAMQYWVRNFNIDGFRCDMAHLVPLDFWKEARTHCDIIKPLFWLAECENANYHPTFDASYAWDWMHVSEKLNQGQVGVNEVYNVLEGYVHYPSKALKLFFTSNHDENSWNGTEYEKYGIAAKPWAVFTHTWKGLPLIYSGQELPNHQRLQFFDKDCIAWGNELALHHFYKTLSHCRKQYPALINGATYNLPTQSNRVMAYLRYDASNVLLIVLNMSNEIQKISFSHELLVGSFINIFSGLQFSFDKEVSFELMPGDHFLYVK
jgi:glycosidase